MRIDIDDTGLPKQIYIAADERELPLELRVPGAQVPDAALAAIGRGNRLRSPMRIEAVVDGKRIPAQVVQGIDANDRILLGVLKAGPFAIEVRKEPRQRDDCTAAYTVDYKNPDRVPADLELIIEPVGPANLVDDGQTKETIQCLATAPASASGPASVPTSAPTSRPTPAMNRDKAIPDGEGAVWKSSEADRSLPLNVFVGTGDGGLIITPLVFGDGDPNARVAMEIRRSKIGEITLAIRLAMAADRNAKGRVHLPFYACPEDNRRPACRQTEWNVEKRIKLLARGLPEDGCEKIGGTVYDYVDLYPNSYLRARIGANAGRTMQFKASFVGQCPGDDPAFDRAFLGRALLHDAGFNAFGLSQPAEYVRLVKGLKGFGFFEANDIEFIPYWRSGAIVRYGEEFNPNSPFKLTEDNPSAGTYVSVYRRPFEKDGKKGYQAMFVIFNEQAKPIRERLYIFTPARIWGGPGNVQTGTEIIAGYDFGKIPPQDSDWRQKKIVDHHYVFGAAALMDIEDRSVANLSDSKGQTAEIYGPLHIQAHDYRVLWGYWLPGVEKKK